MSRLRALKSLDHMKSVIWAVCSLSIGPRSKGATEAKLLRQSISHRLDIHRFVISPVSVTIQHWGFNLDASLRLGGTPTIRNHQLQVAADNILELGPGFIATGKLTPVEGTPHDHRTTNNVLGDRYPKSGYGSSFSFSTVLAFDMKR